MNREGKEGTELGETGRKMMKSEQQRTSDDSRAAVTVYMRIMHEIKLKRTKHPKALFPSEATCQKMRENERTLAEGLDKCHRDRSGKKEDGRRLNFLLAGRAC